MMTHAVVIIALYLIAGVFTSFTIFIHDLIKYVKSHRMIHWTFKDFIYYVILGIFWFVTFPLFLIWWKKERNERNSK